MTRDPKQKGKLPEHVIAPEGTSLFRTVNFERYVRPTSSMRIASYVGTAAFLGFFVYMAYQKDAAQKAKSKQQLTREVQ